MKAAEIEVGGIYYDGKTGVREVLSKEGAPVRVEYKILAAALERQYSYGEKRMVSLIGSTSSSTFQSFAAWAKQRIQTAEACAELLAALQAKRLKLAPGETAFMNSIAAKFGSDSQPNAGSEVSFEFTETRSAQNVAKKGLATVHKGTPGAGGTIILTALGAAWARNRIAAAVAV